jgi:hypothetical protein
MGDTTISNQPLVTAKGNENDIQVNDGSGDLKAIVGLKVLRNGFINASGFIGDGGLLSNVGGGSGVPGGTTNSIQYNAGASTFGGSSNFTFNGTNVSLSGGGMFSGDGGLLSNISGSQTLQQTVALGNTTSNTVQFTGAVTSFVTGGRVNIGSLTAPGANLQVAGNVYASGNITTASYFIGDGSLLTGVTADAASLQSVTNTGNTTSNTVQFTGAAALHFVNNANVSIGSANGSLAIGYNQAISNVGATYIKPIRNTDVFTSNVLSYTQQNELVQNDNIVISTNQVCIGNRTFVNLHTVSCNHGATTNVAVFNFTSPHVGIIKADALMVENSNTSTRHMEWLCRNISGTQIFNTIQAYGSNTSPYGITNITVYPAKDDTSVDNQKFTVGIELLGPQDGASDVTLSLETVGYAKPYIQLSRII